MPKRHHARITRRDFEIFTALDHCPLTARQLLRLSVTFAEPFRTEPRVRGRLQTLRQSGYVKRWRYATATHGGAPDYYKLSLTGYRLLYGEGATRPTKRYSAEIGVAHQHHTRCLSEFIVHLLVSAQRRGLQIVDFCRENTLRLPVGQQALFPDCAFRVESDHGAYNFMVELDNGTERIRTQKDVDSWTRKIQLYDRYQDSAPERFRVLVLTTRSRDRRDRILAAADELVRNRQRSLFYAAHLDDVLAAGNPFDALLFRDHRREAVCLIGAGRGMAASVR